MESQTSSEGPEEKSVEDKIREEELRRVRAEAHKLEAEKRKIEAEASELERESNLPRFLHKYIWQTVLGAILFALALWGFAEKVIFPMQESESLQQQIENLQLARNNELVLDSLDRARTMLDTRAQRVQQLGDSLALTLDENEKLLDRTDSLYQVSSISESDRQAARSQVSKLRTENNELRVQLERLSRSPPPPQAIIAPQNRSACPCFSEEILRWAVREFGLEAPNLRDRSNDGSSDVIRNIYFREEGVDWSVDINQQGDNYRCSFSAPSPANAVSASISRSEAESCREILEGDYPWFVSCGGNACGRSF